MCVWRAHKSTRGLSHMTSGGRGRKSRTIQRCWSDRRTFPSGRGENPRPLPPVNSRAIPPPHTHTLGLQLCPHSGKAGSFLRTRLIDHSFLLYARVIDFPRFFYSCLFLGQTGWARKGRAGRAKSLTPYCILCACARVQVFSVCVQSQNCSIHIRGTFWKDWAGDTDPTGEPKTKSA